MAYPNSQDLLTSPVDPQSMPQPVIHAFPSRITGTTTYIVVDPVTEEAAIINPVLDLDPFTNEIRTRSADRLLKFISDEGLTIKFILETTLHRDRISACRYLQLTLKHIGDGVIPKVCIGDNSFCTCSDDSDADADADNFVSSPTRQENPAGRSSGSSPVRASVPKSPDAFDKLFDDGEQLCIGNMVAQCTHLDDHQGVTYSVAHHTFSSASLARSDDKDPALGVVNHPEPPPDKTNSSPVSSRATPTIDEVLETGDSPVDGSPTHQQQGQQQGHPPQEKQAEVKPSPMLAFYAEQVNTRGGRIPRKINIPPAQRKASLSLSGSGQSSEGAAGGLDEAGHESGSGSGSLKGKEREKEPTTTATEKRGSINGLGAPVPLRIPRKLGVIMC